MAKKSNILSFNDAQRSATTIPVDHNALGKKDHRKGSAAHKARKANTTKSTKASKKNRAHIAYDEQSSDLYSRNSRQYSSKKQRKHQSQKPQGGSAKKSSHFAALKHNVTEKKADRAFAKQFGSANSVSSDDAPRAALYKGQMDARQRRASRIQGKSMSSASGKRKTRSITASSLTTSPRFIGTMAVVVCVVLTCVFLYPAAQQYYHSVREHDQLMAEYTAVTDRNDAIEASVNAMSTDDGIAAEAHSQLGWVQEGEQTARVKGLSESDTDTDAVYASIPSGSVEMPETWYSPVLDVLFGVE